MANPEDHAWKTYSDRFRKEVLPKLMASATFASLASDIGKFDVQQATELGAALLADKPILLVVPRGRQIGSRLRRAADYIVEDWDPADAASQERLADALKQIASDH